MIVFSQSLDGLIIEKDEADSVDGSELNDGEADEFAPASEDEANDYSVQSSTADNQHDDAAAWIAHHLKRDVSALIPVTYRPRAEEFVYLIQKINRTHFV